MHTPVRVPTQTGISGTADSHLSARLESYRASLYAHALRLLGNTHREDADDLVQDTLLQAYQDLSHLRDPAALPTWLHTILRHRCFRFLRSLKSQPICLTCEELDRFPSDITSNKREPQIGLPQIWAAVEHLPEELIVTILLRCFAGLSYDAVADVLGVPVGTVRSRLFNARRKLRAILQDLTEDREVSMYAHDTRGDSTFRNLLEHVLGQPLHTDPFWAMFHDEVRVTYTGQCQLPQTTGLQQWRQDFIHLLNARTFSVHEVLSVGAVRLSEMLESGNSQGSPSCLRMIAFRRGERIHTVVLHEGQEKSSFFYESCELSPPG